VAFRRRAALRPRCACSSSRVFMSSRRDPFSSLLGS